ncbi:MAG: LysR family transcriptional regulator [Mogibacterium kristiansenii]|uniref:LysR family transcriptional regulator n=1 Tax=Mogibacterium kristiansenii TaxID=2606708 RepID=UPI003F0480FC
MHITQPTLSRQMAAFEEDLGITLFIRNGKKISLTDEGVLLKRRALEILDLEERTLEELNGKEEVVEGTITIGCGEFAAVETLAEICKTYKEKYPLVQIVLHTATADAVYEMMNKGLVDIALFMEPVDTEGLDYIRITDCDQKTFRNCRLLLQVILERMPELWQQMDWAIRYPSKVLQSIGGRIFLYSEEFLLKSQQVL